MTSCLRTTWAEAPPIVRATLHAAWIGSKIGAISLATLFIIINLGAGAYYVAAGNMQVLELPGVIISGISILLLSLLVSFVVTVPISVAAACAYPFLRTLEDVHTIVFGIVGFCAGTLVWLWMWWDGPSGNLYFGSWISIFAVGGLAGWAAGAAVCAATSPAPAA